jgi:hypothetical protein
MCARPGELYTLVAVHTAAAAASALSDRDDCRHGGADFPLGPVQCPAVYFLEEMVQKGPAQFLLRKIGKRAAGKPMPDTCTESSNVGFRALGHNVRITKDRKPLLSAIQNSMKSVGWPLTTFRALHPCYANDTVVTPYFALWNLARRRFGCYLIEGALA